VQEPNSVNDVENRTTYLLSDFLLLEIAMILGENRLAFNKTFADCAGAMFKAIIDLALEAPHPTARELLSSTKDVFSRWGSLLCKFLKGSDDEVGYTVHSTSHARTPDAL
jgi:hypothetical protein